MSAMTTPGPSRNRMAAPAAALAGALLLLRAGVVFAQAPAVSPSVGAPAAPGAPGAQHIEGGPIQVDLELDRDAMNAAELLGVTMRVSAPTGVSVELPGSTESGGKLGEWTISSTSDEPARAIEGAGEARTVHVRRFVLEPFLPGEYTLPELEVRWRTLGGAGSGAVRTAPIKVAVSSLLPPAKAGEKPDAKALDPGELRGEYRGTEAAPSRWLLLGLAGAGAGVLAVAGGMWAARARRGVGDPVDGAFWAVSGVEPSPDAEARRRGCDVFSRAIRDALADRVDPAASASTPAELAGRLAEGGRLTADQARGAVELLERLDALRFSGGEASEAEFESLRGAAIELVAKLRAMARGGRRLGEGGAS